VEIASAIGIKNLGEMLQRRARPWESAVNVTPQQRSALDRYWEAFPSIAEGWGQAFLPQSTPKAIEAYDRAIAVDPGDPRPRYLRAMSMARFYLGQPDQFQTPAQRQRAIAVIEAGLRPGEMPAERFAARARAALGLLYVEEGNQEKAREQARLLYRITPVPEEQRVLLKAVGEAPQG
jgi:tetratricopeptide (TPR) repeat protein